MNKALGIVLAVALLNHIHRDAIADLALTPAGTAEGFGLSTFATGFTTSSGIGPIGIAFPTSGGVLVSNYPGDVRLFPPDTDGNANATGIAQIGNSIYANQASNSNVVQLNPDGTFNQQIVNVPNPVNNNLTGLALDPITQHLFVSVPTTPGLFNQILDVDPISKTSQVFLSGTFTDGLVFNANGSILFAATASNSVTGFNATNGAVVFVNTVAGQVIQLDLTTLAQTVIATGGSRGDFLTADPNNGTLMVTQFDSVMRLTAPQGGGFLAAVPEPSTIVMWLVGFGVFMVTRAKSLLRTIHSL